MNFKVGHFFAVLLGMIFVFSNSNIAQPITIIAQHGDVQVLHGQDWKKIAAGHKLHATAKVKLAEGCYLALANNSGKHVELDEAGTYDLTVLFTDTKPKVSNKYLEHVTNNAIANSTIAEKPVSNTSTPNQSILQIAPRNSYILEDKITFIWRSVVGAETYKVEIKDSKGKQLIVKEVKDTVLILPIKLLTLSPNECYKWTVKTTNLSTPESDALCFHLFDKSKKTSVVDSLANIEAELAQDEKTAVGQLILATFYQHNNINDKAMACYERALHMAPALYAYKQMYAEFLNSLGLAEYATKVVGRN